MNRYTLGKWLLGAAGFAGTTALVRLGMRADSQHIQWWINAGFAIVAMLSSALVLLRQWHYWHEPALQLAELLEGARLGEVPIEELSRINGGMKMLIPVAQEILRDLKMQKMEVAALSDEMRQRIAGRTAALERQMGSLRAQAMRDGLTGLYNRRVLDATLPKLIEQSLADGKDLCVVMMDVDNFKLLNDTRGHAIGDDFLKSLGQIIRSSMRGQDFGFRCGGDEFVLVMPGAMRSVGESIAERLGSLVDQLSATLHSPRPPRLSCGIAALSDVGERGAGTLVERADAALYAIKAQRKSLRAA